VTTTFDTGGYAEFDLELGAFIRRFADVLVGGRNIWDEDKFLPKKPGAIEQEDAGTDIQSNHYLDTYNDQTDYPSYEAIRKSHNDTLGTKTATIDGEELWLKEIYGVESGGDWQLAAYLKVEQDGAAGAGGVPANLTFYASNEILLDAPLIEMGDMADVYLGLMQGAGFTVGIAGVGGLGIWDGIDAIFEHAKSLLFGAGEYIMLNQAEGVGIGTTFHPTANPEDVIFFKEKANDPTLAATTAGLYAKTVADVAEMFAIDETGNTAQLTPHDPETGEWVFYTKNVKTGRVLKVQMEAMMRLLDKRLGGGYIQDYMEEIQ